MRIARLLTVLALWAGAAVMVGGLASCWTMDWSEKSGGAAGKAFPIIQGKEKEQVPSWSQADMDFFLHGSMSTEVVPETVFRAFIQAYPQIYPTRDLSHLGLIPDGGFGWPIGFSRGKPAHLAGLPSVGINCASCHVTEVRSSSGGPGVRILGVSSLFDAEAFFNAIVGSGFLSGDPANMKKFIAAYLDTQDPERDATRRASRQKALAALWEKQLSRITAAMKADPVGANGAGPGGLHPLSARQFALTGSMLAGGSDPDLAALSVSMLKLFHNMRAALHVPDQLPEKLPPSSGPGRNDAFGLLSLGLFHEIQPYAPVKYGLVWNVEQRKYVHWDGNTRSPIARNVLATVGLGAPLIDKKGIFDFQLIKRHTQLSEAIAAPAYPFPIDREAAKRGALLYQAACASCHNGAEDDNRLYSPQSVGTDPVRATAFTQQGADRFNQFLGSLESEGYVPPTEAGIRSTQKYWSPSLAGVWARSPYLHNGSVRTMKELLSPPAQRAVTFHRGSRIFNEKEMGYTDEGSYLLDTKSPGSSNVGHEYGTALTDPEKRDLMEYLKSL